MTTPIYTSPFTGTVVTPTDVSYSALPLNANTPLFWPAIVNQALGEAVATRIIDVTPNATNYSISANTTTTFTIASQNLTGVFVNGVTINFNGSATVYTVVSSTLTSGNTVVTFTSALSSGTTVTSVAFALKIALPQGDQGTVGADILFRNLGSISFIVTDYTGANSVTIASGISKYFYLQDNSTIAGTWGNVTFGAATSSADAATLAGAGLTTVNGQLATTQNVVDISVSPTISDSSRAITYNWIGGAGNINLPSISTLSTGWYIAFRNSSTGALTFTPPSPQKINGQTIITTNPGDSGFIFYDASLGAYITVGWVTPNNVVFTAATYDVDSISGNTLNLSANAPIIQTYVAQTGARTATLAVTLPAITQFYILNNSTNQSGYNITFQNSGSTQTPIILSNGQIFTVLSDGEFLYVLNSSSSSTFRATNGTASGPSYSFLNDNTSGMYLVGSGILGLAANGQELIDINGSNLSAPIVTVNGKLNAQLISGGTF
jgi:hypothetical protein